MSHHHSKDHDGKGDKPELDRIKVRPWPKMVMLYPMIFMSLLFGILTLNLKKPEDGGTILAVIFLFTLGANMFVMTFEFNKLKSLVIFFLILAFIFGALFVAERYKVSVLTYLSSAIAMIQPWANSRFYFMLSGLLLLMFGIMFLHTRLDYWEITHNELLHHHGLMGNVKRYPVMNLRFDKEINDIVEYSLFFSGTLILKPQHEERPIILDNIPFINRVERDMKHLLSKLAVDIEPG